MNKRGSISTLVLILALAGRCLTVWGQCLNFYRHDVTEYWTVPDESSLCKVDKARNEDPNKYGIMIKEGILYITSLDFEIPLRDCPITEKGRQYEFSVSINKPGLKFPHFFTIIPTSNKTLVYTFKDSCFETWDNADCRTIFYIEESAIEKKVSRYQGFQIYTIVIEALVGLAAIPMPNLAVIFNTVFIFGTSFFMLQSGFIDLRLFVAMAMLIILAALFVICLLISMGRRFYINMIGILVIIAFLRVNTFLETFWIGVIGIATLGIGWMVFENNSLAEKYYFEVGFSIIWIQQYQFWSTVQYITFPEFIERVFISEDLRRGHTGREDGFSLVACLWAAGILLACFISAFYWHRRIKFLKNTYDQIGSLDIDFSRFD